MDVHEGGHKDTGSMEFLIEGRVTDVVMDDAIEPAHETAEGAIAEGEDCSELILIDKGVTLAHDLPID